MKKDDQSDYKSHDGKSNFLEESIKNFATNLINKDNTIKIKSRNFNHMIGKTDSSIGSQALIMTEKYLMKQPMPAHNTYNTNMSTSTSKKVLNSSKRNKNQSSLGIVKESNISS